jgi:hypothetical protein
MRAKFRDRISTSVFRRKNKKRRTLHEWIRSIVWPIGEETEVGIWIACAQSLPLVMCTLTLLIVINLQLGQIVVHKQWEYVAYVTLIVTLTIYYLLNKL